jgi:hypothetical protein
MREEYILHLGTSKVVLTCSCGRLSAGIVLGFLK